MASLRRSVAGAIVVLLALAATVGADGARRPVAVIVAKGSKVTELSRAELKRAFSGDAVSVGGVRIIPFNHSPSSAPRVAFDRAILGMVADEVGRYWIDRKIRGQSGAPRVLATTAIVLKVVAKFPGAIAYLPADEVTADVQVIAIDGVRPSQAGYPIEIK
jgi:hypothetical protein